jgi:hypothetical protein
MNASWTQIDHINMTIQTADFQLLGRAGETALTLSCALTNIARGTCQIEIRPAADNLRPISPQALMGNLTIELNRRVMQSSLLLTAAHFSDLVSALARPAPRPASLTLRLAENLTVSIQGDLSIEKETEIPILDISFNFPTR